MSLRLRQRDKGRYLPIGKDEQEFAEAHDAVHVHAVGMWQIGGGHDDAQPLSSDHLREGRPALAAPRAPEAQANPNP